ncbi:restriction endonuclease subunit S [Sulfurimonas sp. HSL3-7]|uniref:restriction endonuclease subunit S n=1 Tax=Sulfonitrofixus jiaomeiensis TaxID=3131938 RepID=UPI0031F96F87
MNELYELPEGWEWTKLGAVCNLLNGYAFKAKEYVEKSDTVIIRMGNIRPNGEFDAEHKIKYLPNKYAIELPNYILSEGDLIIAMTDLASEMRILGNPTLVSNLNGRTFMLNQRVGKLYDFNLEKVVVKYLRYILTAHQIKDYYKSLGGGGLQINIGKQQILSVDLPLPPISEQQRLVSKLDLLFEKIDKSIALHQKNMDEADLFMGSVLNDVFGELEEKYDKDQLGNTVKIIGGGTPSKNKKVYWDNGNINWATVGDMNVETIKKTELSITEKGLEESSSNIIPKEAIIIATRVGLGKVCYLEHDTAINQDLKGLLPLNDKVNIRFLFNYFKNIKEYLINNGTGATVKGVKLDFIKTLELPLPPLQIQQKIVKYLDEVSQKIEKIKSVQKDKMGALKALKASILDQAFRGEL